MQSAKADQHGHDRVRLRHARESASKVKRNTMDAMRIGTTCKHLHPKARVYTAVQRYFNRQVGQAMEHDHEKEIHAATRLFLKKARENACAAAAALAAAAFFGLRMFSN